MGNMCVCVCVCWERGRWATTNPKFFVKYWDTFRPLGGGEQKYILSPT